MIWVNITNEDGELLESIFVYPSIDGEIKSAAHIREMIEQKYDIKEQSNIGD